MPLLSPENRESEDDAIRVLRKKLCDGAEYLHQLYRLNENLTTDDQDIDDHIATWEKIVDDRAKRLCAVFALARLAVGTPVTVDQKR